MNRNYIEQHLIIDRYLLGSLDESELAEFEERLVWDEALLEEVELAERLRDALRASVTEDRYTQGPRGIRRRLAGAFEAPRYAAAASFLLAVTLTSAFLLGPIGVVRLADGPSFAPRVVRLEMTRSGDSASISADSSTLMVLLVDARTSGANGTFESYRVSIRTAEAGAVPLWSRDGLDRGYEDSLAIAIPGSSLPEGRYLLRIEGAVNAGTDGVTFEFIQEIPFRSARAE